MRVKRTLETDRFEVQNDAGKIYTIVEETQQNGIISKGSTEWENGAKSYRIVDNGYLLSSGLAFDWFIHTMPNQVNALMNTVLYGR